MEVLVGGSRSSSRKRRRRGGGVLVISTICVTVGFGLVPTAQLSLLRAVPEDILRHGPIPPSSLDTKTPKANSAGSTNGRKLTTISHKFGLLNREGPKPSIPHILYFTHKTNILETKEPEFIYDNVMHTIEAYRTLWNEKTAPALFLDDDMCREKIQATEPRLLSFFNKEKLGMYKADICRVAALYLTGGYYFDVDIIVYQPVDLAYNVTFSSCREAPIHVNCNEPNCHENPRVKQMQYRLGAQPYGKNNLFQAFLATSPGHPVLKKAFDLMLSYYELRYSPHGGLGVSTLGDALAELSASQSSVGAVRLLKEVKNTENMKTYYPDLPRQNGTGTGCSKIVHDESERKVYFYSRIPGVDKSCTSTKHNSLYS